MYDKLVAKVNSIDTSAFGGDINVKVDLSNYAPKTMTQTKQSSKIKFLILAVLLKRRITMLKSLK